jgi:mRNA interferase RelE/StbE
MRYEVVLARSAEREFEALPSPTQERVAAALQGLADQPRPRGARKLSQGQGWRLRLGDYRVLYVIDKSAGVITIFGIAHRREAYRK